MLKSGLTHSCRRLWGFTADHLFQLLAVINFFSSFLLLLRYFGKKYVLGGTAGLQRHIFIFLLRETIWSGCSCYKRIKFLLGFLNREFVSCGQAGGHSILFISFPPCIWLIPPLLLYCCTSTKEFFLCEL